MRLHIILFAVASCFLITAPSISFGQSFLDRLEKTLSDTLTPADKAKEKSATAESGFLGLTADEADGKGVDVIGMRDFSPAQIGGLEIGDLITAVNGKQIRNLNEMAAALAGKSAGSKVEFKVMRGVKEHAYLFIV